MSDDFFDSYIAAKTMRNTEDVAEQLRAIRADMQQNMVPMDKYNKLMEERNDLVFKYNCDTSRYIAQRDEAAAIIKENIEILPFSYEDVRERVNAKGDAAAEAERVAAGR